MNQLKLWLLTVTLCVSFIVTNFRPVSATVNLGKFATHSHGVMSSDVYLIDDKTIEITDFSYSGSGPAAWFVVGKGTTMRPKSYTVLPNDEKSCNKLGKYQKKTIRLSLPDQMSFRDIDWLMVYCLQFKVNFGHITIPNNKVDGLSNGFGTGLQACKTRWNS